eukprot:4804485-Prymnesium_polylepis.1
MIIPFPEPTPPASVSVHQAEAKPANSACLQNNHDLTGGVLALHGPCHLILCCKRPLVLVRVHQGGIKGGWSATWWTCNSVPPGTRASRCSSRSQRRSQRIALHRSLHPHRPRWSLHC